MHPARLFVLCGLPGSGTTQRAAEVAERFAGVRMSVEDVIEATGGDSWDALTRRSIEAWQLSLTVDLLRAGQTVVVEWGPWSRAGRDELRHRGRSAGAFVHLEHLDAPVDVLWEQVRGREHESGGRAISLDDLNRWVSEFERPTADELASFDPAPPVRAGEQPGSPAFPYGSWRP